jgi:hypothetical protein
LCLLALAAVACEWVWRASAGQQGSADRRAGVAAVVFFCGLNSYFMLIVAVFFLHALAPMFAELGGAGALSGLSGLSRLAPAPLAAALALWPSHQHSPARVLVLAVLAALALLTAEWLGGLGSAGVAELAPNLRRRVPGLRTGLGVSHAWHRHSPRAYELLWLDLASTLWAMFFAAAATLYTVSSCASLVGKSAGPQGGRSSGPTSCLLTLTTCSLLLWSCLLAGLGARALLASALPV